LKRKLHDFAVRLTHVRWAEEIMNEIDIRWPGRAS